MSRCDEYQELISGKLDGSLSPFEEKRLEAHLEACPECRALAAELSQLHEAFQKLPLMTPPADLTQRISAAVAADNITPLPTPEQVKKSSHWKQWTASAAVIALAVLGVGTFRSDFSAPAPSQTPVTMEAPAAADQPAVAAEAPMPREEQPAAFAMEGPQPRLVGEAPVPMEPEQQLLELCAETLFPEFPTSYDPEQSSLTVTWPEGSAVLSCTEAVPEGISTVEVTVSDGEPAVYLVDLTARTVTLRN